jgi:hypothetical protein
MGSSKSRKAKRRRRCGLKRRQTPLESLNPRLEQGLLRKDEFIIEPGGAVKMSEVLTDFLEPYFEFAGTDAAYQKLLRLAIAAWNTSLLPEEEQQDMVDKVLRTMPATSEELKTELRETVKVLIARKKARFSEYKRRILDFELIATGNGYHLSVASTLERPPSQ